MMSLSNNSKFFARDMFSGLHPIIGFIYFAFVILVTVFFLHPVVLVVSFLSALAYAIRLNGLKALRFTFLLLLPMMFFAAILNPLFNHQGATILFYFGMNPITLESIMYGCSAAMMIGAVILWFSCYNIIMTSDKFLYLFGRIIPALSLVISMALRFVPRYKAQIKRIAEAQKSLGRSFTTGKLIERAKCGMSILSIMVTWALENAVETSDSMRSRGFGLKGRTSYSIFRFDVRDKTLLALVIIFIIVIIAAVVTRIVFIENFPLFYTNELSFSVMLVYAAFALICVFPMLLDGIDAVQWHFSRSKN